MYLARKRVGDQWTYRLRQSYRTDERIRYRELFDLGEDPSTFIVYPGGNSFYFDEALIKELGRFSIPNLDQRLEAVFLPFLRPHIQRIISQMTKLKRSNRLGLSREAMIRSQARLHLFDRRRFFYIRFGRMDTQKVIMRPHRFLNKLVDKSRDEMEYYFQKMEFKLRLREKKQYVYHALDLGRYFPGDVNRIFPQGINEESLDEAFLADICRLNGDRDFLDTDSDPDESTLHEYLTRYVCLWFDFEFGQRPPRAQILDEFIYKHRAYKPPPPAPTFPRSKALTIFCISEEKWRGCTRSELTRIYRRLALTAHPDQGGDPEAFIELNSAYECLIGGK